MKILKIAIITFTLMSINSNVLMSQPKMGINAGFTYMAKELEEVKFSSKNGKNLDVYCYPLSFSGVEVGASIGYKAKGYINESLPSAFIRTRQSPLEYISFSIPVRKSFDLGNSIDVFLKLGVRFETPIFDKNRFQPLIGTEYISFNNLFGYTIGTGLNLKSIYPNLILDISYNPDLTSFIRGEMEKLSSLEFKFGIQFEGFKSN